MDEVTRPRANCRRAGVIIGPESAISGHRAVAENGPTARVQGTNLELLAVIEDALAGRLGQIPQRPYGRPAEKAIGGKNIR